MTHESPILPAISSVRSAPDDPTANSLGRYRLAPEVVLVRVRDGTARLLDLSGNFYAFTGTAAAMLDEVLDHPVDEASRRLATQFQASEERIRADMESFLASLVRRGLVFPPGSPPTPRRIRRTTASAVMVPLLRLAATGPRSLTSRAAALLTVAWFSCRVFGWTETVHRWQQAAHRRDVLRYVRTEKIAASLSAAVVRAISLHPLPMGCKERALSCFYLARSEGLPARIVLGIDLFPIAVHCWSDSGQEILADRYDGHCDRYTPILTYD